MQISKLFELEEAPSRIHTREQALADEIFSYFKEDISFSKIMGLIKRKGEQKVYTAYNEVKNSNPKNPPALFIWKATR